MFAFQRKSDFPPDLMLNKAAGTTAGERFNESTGAQHMMDLKIGAFF